MAFESSGTPWWATESLMNALTSPSLPVLPDGPLRWNVFPTVAPWTPTGAVSWVVQDRATLGMRHAAAREDRTPARLCRSVPLVLGGRPTSRCLHRHERRGPAPSVARRRRLARARAGAEAAPRAVRPRIEP